MICLPNAERTGERSDLERRALGLTMLILVAVAALATVLTVARPAAAELGETQETWWGLETKGPSRILDGWRNDPLGWAVEPSGGAVFVGGQFLDITNGDETIRQPYLAAFDAGTGRPLRWITPQFGGPVLALEQVVDGGLIVGGEMDEFNGNTVGALVKIDPTTGAGWPGWQTRVYGGSSVVRDVRVESDGWMYVVGDFTTAKDPSRTQAVSGAIRMHPVTGVIDWDWIPDVGGGAVWGVSVSKTVNEVYLAGWFTTLDGNSSARGFASVDAVTATFVNGRETIVYNTCIGCSSNYRMYDVLATEFGDVWVVGEQHANFILNESDLSMRLMHYTGCNLAFQNDCSRAGGEFQEIERVGDRVYASCHCWGWHQTGTQPIFHSSSPTGTPTGAISSVAAYDVQTGQRIQSFQPYMSGNGGGFAIAATSDGCLWLAGGYDQVGQPGDQRRARDLVRLCDEAGPGPDPQPDPVDPGAPVDAAPPTVCTAENSGRDAVLNWEPSPDAIDYRLFRSIDGGPTYWRGTSSDGGFRDTLQVRGMHSYTVQARGANGVWSDSTVCTAPLDPADGVLTVSAPATCGADNVGQTASISWSGSAGATDYRVFRSVDGGTDFWRGVSSTTSFADTLRDVGLHTYSVQARGAAGVWSSSTLCGSPLDPAAGILPVMPPTECVASNEGVSASLSWVPSPGAIDYRVFRSVDQSADFWRGLVTTPSFADTLRDVGLHTYSVQARGAAGVWSASAPCSSSLTP